MGCKKFWEKVVPFALAFALGVFVTSSFQKINLQNETPPAGKCMNRDYSHGIGMGGGGGRRVEIATTPRAGTNPLQIVSKPRPTYTDAARQNQVTGIVRLRVTFLASGQIGSVSPVNSLPDGLTEQAIIAAQNIKFEPATADGKPTTVAKVIEYSFTIY